MDECCSVERKGNGNTIMREESLVSKETQYQSRFRIEKMDCPTEERLIRKSLEVIPGVVHLEFDLLDRLLTVHHTFINPSILESSLGDIGMVPIRFESDQAEPTVSPAMGNKEKILLGIGGAAALSAEAAAWISGSDTSWLIFILAVVSIVTAGLPTLHKGWIAFRSFTININFLMSLAVIGAIAIRKWPEAAMVIFLFAIAEGIERLSLENARNAIRSLSALAPDFAEIRSGSGWERQAVNEVQPGATIRLRAGERVPLDSRLQSDNITVNEAPITGESLPIDKVPGDPLFAGSVVVDGAAEATVTAIARESTLARIAKAVQEAQKERAPTQRFVDSFSRYYTPAAFALAILVMVLGSIFGSGGVFRWIYEGLVILVIACPCALVISTPVSIVSGLTTSARRGILIKGGVYLEGGKRLRVIAIDKTGTLTMGKPQLIDIVPIRLDSEKWALRIAASLDEQSTHPIARAIVDKFRETDSNTSLMPVSQFRVLQGRGVTGEIDGAVWHLGNHRMAEELGVCSVGLESILQDIENAGETALVLTGPTGPVAAFGVADVIRAEGQHAIRQLKKLGIRPVMLTGDNKVTASSVAAQLEIEDARGDLLPEDKAMAVAELREQFGPVGMVGDGINDAPALARADIGLAMGAAGTATALDTADVAIMDDDLRKVAEFVQLSTRTNAVLKQNIVIALLIKALFLGLALTQHATLWMAVFADMGGSLLVVANGLRLAREKVVEQS